MSNAQQIKVFYKEVLEDQREHSRIELFNYARRRSNNLYTDGMLTGALRTLVTDTGDYICVRRGWYKKKSREERIQEPNSLVQAYVEIFQDTLRKSKNITSDPFRVLKMPQEDVKKLERIEKCITMISDTLEKIR
ncbi:hypothetical protein [Blautia sp. XA-2221]|uniref:hypothetical protein n=1 Tax=Blautia sp. XA-2221 TaxID=2903961 RepID=UPI002379D5EF|nr:hypothetical protein [Blautia sp. XA-2221]